MSHLEKGSMINWMGNDYYVSYIAAVSPKRIYQIASPDILNVFNIIENTSVKHRCTDEIADILGRDRKIDAVAYGYISGADPLRDIRMRYCVVFLSERERFLLTLSNNLIQSLISRTIIIEEVYTQYGLKRGDALEVDMIPRFKP